MTEITRVPLQPVKKGSLSKIWVGALALALAGSGIAYAAMPAQVSVKTLTAGSGPSPTVDDMVLINYKGTLPDGKVFDQAKQVPMELGGVIPGFATALEKMQRGGKYTVKIPSELAYGDHAQGPIPANTDLTFEIELLDFRSKAEIEQQQRMMQQMMQMQQQQQGAAGAGAPGGAPGAAQ
ncbi:FKBP-type peptidyl-prolyl cis-trans isomerase [Novosphingobium sp. 1949]|uniref:Peptidyl-prolyl cis-trans isomerase n=1 Tax=Novosphingobium organovorum TaxID=2930092 RepID=A0ABT0BFW4_9SPHN|nr:FKBP-type peptidyl-prolyl cis-trans isomerase [Novosphingobium organovorum]MCJ2183952.1 FKBP-type peptidyl-prolyl cis-trans isomerase [Novosphingobium organovorum]